MRDTKQTLISILFFSTHAKPLKMGECFYLVTNMYTRLLHSSTQFIFRFKQPCAFK